MLLSFPVLGFHLTLSAGSHAVVCRLPPVMFMHFLQSVSIPLARMTLESLDYLWRTKVLCCLLARTDDT